MFRRIHGEMERIMEIDPFSLIVSRASFVFAVQTWLAQTPDQARKAGTPGYLAAGMARKFPRLVDSEAFII